MRDNFRAGSHEPYMNRAHFDALTAKHKDTISASLAAAMRRFMEPVIKSQFMDVIYAHELFEKLDTAYMPKDDLAQATKYCEFFSMQQTESETADEFISRAIVMRRELTDSGATVTDAQQTVTILNGLSSRYIAVKEELVNKSRPATMEEIIRRVHITDQWGKQKHQRKQHRHSERERERERRAPMLAARAIPPDRSIALCKLCDKPGHFYEKCPMSICAMCGRRGHIVRKCPTARSSGPVPPWPQSRSSAVSPDDNTALAAWGPDSHRHVQRILSSNVGVS
jgi:hypothetical protein